MIPEVHPQSRFDNSAARPRTLAAPLLAGVTVLSAMANLLAALPHVLRRGGAIPTWLPLEITHGSRVLSAAAGIFLLILARAIARRKRAAWQLAIALFLLSALVHPFKGKLEYVALLPAAMAVLFLLSGREFWVKSDPVTRAGGWSVMAMSVLLAYGYTAAGYWLLRSHFAAVTDGSDALLAALGLLTTFQTGEAFPLNREAAAFAWSACALEGIGLFTGLFLILAPFIERRFQESERPLVDPFLRRHGRSSTSYFALEGDTRYLFLRNVPGVVPYTYSSGAALVAGEPLCDSADMVRACEEFSEFCEEHDWAPAYYQMSPAAREALEARDFAALKIGEECVYDLPGYSIRGAQRARLRHGVSRAEREGVTVVEHIPGTPGSDRRQARMEALSAEWLKTHGGLEMGYLLGGYSFRNPRDRRYFVAEKGGTVVGVVTFVPIYAASGMVLDLMRRSPDAPQGTMEALVHRALESFQSEGLALASLALAPLAHVAEPGEGAPGAQRVLAAAFERLNRVYNFKTLHTFKHRLGPDRWESRYLVYRNNRALPAIALALLRVHEPRSLYSRLLRPAGRPAFEPPTGEEGRGDRAVPS